MANSGVKVPGAVKTAFDEFKMKKKHRYLIFKVDKDTIVVDKEGSLDSTFNEFVEELQGIEEGRFAVYDYMLPGVEKKSKICFVSWIPDNLPVKERMLYASSKDSLKKVMDGLQVDIHACDEDNLKEAHWIEKASR